MYVFNRILFAPLRRRFFVCLVYFVVLKFPGSAFVSIRKIRGFSHPVSPAA